jgi:hypothetical protein
MSLLIPRLFSHNTTCNAWFVPPAGDHGWWRVISLTQLTELNLSPTAVHLVGHSLTAPSRLHDDNIF